MPGSSEIHALVFNDPGAKERHGGAVHGEFAQRHGLLVRFVVGLVLRNTFQGSAGIRHLDIEILKKKFGGCHWLNRYPRPDCTSGVPRKKKPPDARMFSRCG